MRNLLIKYFALSYESKLGNPQAPGKYLRAVLPCLIAFFIGVIFSLFSEQDPFYLFLSWVPFIITAWFGAPWFGIGYFGLYPIKYSELQDKSQKLQMLLANPKLRLERDSSFPTGLDWHDEFVDLQDWHDEKFKNKSNVNLFIALIPWIILVVGSIVSFFILRAGYGQL